MDAGSSSQEMGMQVMTQHLEGTQRMYSLKERKRAPQGAPPQPILAAKRRRQLHPFLFHMGPVALCITSVILIGLMAVLYLSQQGQALAANQQLQQIHTQQAILERQNQDLLDTVAYEQSPAYIADNAKKLGLVPADPKTVQMLVVPHLRPIPHNQQNMQP
jgi:cell division protein FtsL